MMTVQWGAGGLIFSLADGRSDHWPNLSFGSTTGSHLLAHPRYAHRMFIVHRLLCHANSCHRPATDVPEGAWPGMAAMEAPAECADTADVHPAPSVAPAKPPTPDKPVYAMSQLEKLRALKADRDDEKTLVDLLHDAQSAALEVKAGNAGSIEKVLTAIVAALDHEHCHHEHL